MTSFNAEHGVTMFEVHEFNKAFGENLQMPDMGELYEWTIDMDAAGLISVALDLINLNYNKPVSLWGRIIGEKTSDDVYSQTVAVSIPEDLNAEGIQNTATRLAYEHMMSRLAA